MIETENFQTIEARIHKNEWDKIHKISIYYEEMILLKWLVLFNSEWSWYRKYFIRVTYKNRTKRCIAISKGEKDLIKPSITNFNFYVGGLAFLK